MIPRLSCLARSAFSAAAMLLLGFAVTSSARAACNAIPDAASNSVGATRVIAIQEGKAAQSPAVVPGVIGFKAGLGRIDRMHILPGATSGFRVQADGLCIQQGEGGKLSVRDLPGPRSSDRLEGSDFIVSLLSKSVADGSIRAFVLGDGTACGILGDVGSHESGDTNVELYCEPLPPVVERPETGQLNIRVRLPDSGGLFVGDVPLTGPVTVLVTPKPRSRAMYDALVVPITTDGCAKHCGELANSDALGCLGMAYAILPSDTVVSDPITCDVSIIPPGVSKNVFKEKCEDSSPPATDLESCDDDRTELQLWEDSCGGVHIPFDWDAIRKNTTTNTDVTRVVAGRSATARAEKGKLADSRIWVPGREFLGSTPWDDITGTVTPADWRKPDIEVWYPSASPEEIGLRGSVDELDSVVHIYPHMPVSLACGGVSGEEACMAVEGGGGIQCACRDRYAADCDCIKLASPKYFACEGGDFDHMPCTRHRHCNSKPGSGNPDGTCSRKPSCRKDGKHGVWPAAAAPSNTECWDKHACGTAHPQCGYRLFDISDRKDHPTHPGRIDLNAEIATAGASRRGVCEANPNTKCNPSSQCSGSVKCRGYMLRAEGEKP